jgi:hypothetical protein
MDALKELGGEEPAAVLSVLHKTNLRLQEDLKGAMQDFSFHFRQPPPPPPDGAEPDDRSYIAPEVWAPLSQATGFSPFMLHDWF